MTQVKHARDRGWTRRPAIAPIVQQAVDRFMSIYPWAAPHPTFNPEQDLCYLMLTAEELLVLQSHIPASIETQCGHNDGPSWNECVRLATDNPGCLFAGFLMPPARCDEGIDLDAVYVPLPDQDDVCAMEAMTRPDGRRHGPDEDGVENINGRKYRRLWWD